MPMSEWLMPIPGWMRKTVDRRAEPVAEDLSRLVEAEREIGAQQQQLREPIVHPV